MLSTRAVFDGNYLELIIYGPFQSIQQNILYVFDALIPTNAITQSPNFGLASCGQLLNKQPFGNNPVVAYEAVSLIISPQTINYGSKSLDAKKLLRSNYKYKLSFVIAFGTGSSNTSVQSPIGTCCGSSPIENAGDIKSSIPSNDDNNRSPPPANKTDVSSLPVLTNPVALELALNVFVPLISQLLVVLTQFVSFESISDIVKQVLATGSHVSSYVQPNGLTYFNLPVIVYQIEPSKVTFLLYVSVFEYVYVFVQQSDKSVGVPANSEIGLVPPAPSNTTVSSAPDLTNDAPVTVAIPSIELTNLQALLKILFAVIVYEVPQVIQPLKSTSPTLIYDINQSVSVLIYVVD
ncbi:MAG: hypothetical protein EZS28_009758 [Streblomastix strix]|uniref:Uncharacterized protein n=1 Tax=Streblomastix strix TaxID=222440 RepID=A0A5J4WK62_9EUKA|nr:MAG: hypothetical protein EZS28_009758 [Streblomastix strix]